MMSRRRLVALAAAAAILGLGALAAIGVVAVTQTAWGRSQVRDLVQRQLASSVQGHVYIGAISGGLFGGVSIDSVELRDTTGALFIATGPITAEYDPRDLLDQRILLRHVRVERPVVHLVKGQDEQWNWRRIFPNRPARPRAPGRGFGDFIVIDSATVVDGVFTLTRPWQPADSLRGVRRDSAVREALSRPDSAIRRDGDGFARTWRWTGGQAVSTGMRLAYPDSAGRHFGIGRLDVVEHDPPFQFRNLRGDVRVQGDSVWLDVAHFDLPASTGSAVGKIVWGSDLPVRYDITVRGDSVALADVAWVYETLPRTGGGSTTIHIGNDPDDLDVMDYALTDLDLRTTGSRLRGRMTYGVGGPVLVLKDVDLVADPVDVDLLRTLAGGPFPYDWQGTITGRVAGRGGPLTRFRVDTASLVFRDAHVPGAVSEFSGRGELDVLSPALTKFRGFEVDVARLDLRTPRAVNPEFAALGGTVSGRAVLDSVWLDLRVRRADVTHRDTVGEASRFTGGGRVTLAEPFLIYDLDMVASPVSFTALSGSYPGLPLRGSYAGPLRVRGTLENLQLAGQLTGAGGTMAVDGRFGLMPGGLAATGTARVDSLDLRTLLARADLPATRLSARSTFDVRGDSLATTAGILGLELEPSLVAGVPIDSSMLRLTMGDGRARLDSLRLHAASATLTASGGLGLVAAHRDSVQYVLQVDSLGLLAARLGARDPATMQGAVTLRGALAGSAAGVDVTGTVVGRGLRAGALSARALSGGFLLADVLRQPIGSARLEVDTAAVGRVRLRTAAVTAQVHGRGSAGVQVAARSVNGVVTNLLADVRRDSTGTSVVLDTAFAVVGGNRWSLLHPATIRSDALGLSIDSVDVRGSAGGRFTAGGVVPWAGAVDVHVTGDSIPLRDLGLVAQVRTPFDGSASFHTRVRGVREAPLIALDGRLEGAQFGELRLARVTTDARYADRRLQARATLAQGDTTLLRANATLPLDLALARRDRRVLDEPLTGTIRSDRVDLSVLEGFTTAVREASGAFMANLDLGGTLTRPAVRGGLQVVDGTAVLPAMGTVRVRDVQGDVVFEGDSVVIRRLAAATRDGRDGFVSLVGGISFADLTDPVFDVTLVARDFHAIDEARVANLDVSTTPSLHLTGPLTGATLTGGIRVERGTIYMPELTSKRVIELDDPEFYNVVDTTVLANRSLLPSPPPRLVRGLTLRNVGAEVGGEVWLRGPEANINLGGRLNLTTARDTRPGPDPDRARLALDGLLTATRGTYRLNLNVVQRTFVIEQGALRFFGDPEFNPTLDLSAIHTVRPYDPVTARRDVRIRASITGTLAQPQLTLSSADDTQLSESDLLSYLVTGAPSYAVGGNQANEVTAARLALTSLGSYLGSRATGGIFDVVQFQTSGVQTQGDLQAVGAGILSGTRLGLGVQISDRAFVTADAGLCQLGNVVGGQSFNATDFASSIGVKVDYRLSGPLSLSVGLEPSTSQRFCRADQGARGFAPTPRQFTFDLFRTWRF